jgi:hypothetical protein
VQHRRLLAPIGHVPPAAFEAAYHREDPSRTAGLKDPSLRETQGGSISKLPVLGQVLQPPRWRSCSPSDRFGGSMLAKGGSSPMSLNRLRLAGPRTS